MSDLAFLKQVKQAVGRGQTVVIPAPGTAPSLHDKDAALAAALCQTFALSHGESRLLGRLLVYEFSTQEELRTAVSRSTNQPIAHGSLQVFVSSLRKKLRPHNVTITTVPRSGYAIDKKSRDRIYEQLAQHDLGFSLKRLQGEQPHTE
jgi:hypothetical protein